MVPVAIRDEVRRDQRQVRTVAPAHPVVDMLRRLGAARNAARRFRAQHRRPQFAPLGRIVERVTRHTLGILAVLRVSHLNRTAFITSENRTTHTNPHIRTAQAPYRCLCAIVRWYVVSYVRTLYVACAAVVRVCADCSKHSVRSFVRTAFAQIKPGSNSFAQSCVVHIARTVSYAFTYSVQMSIFVGAQAKEKPPEGGLVYTRCGDSLHRQVAALVAASVTATGAYRRPAARRGTA